MEFPSILLNFLQETWWLTAEMAPYLLLGFIIAGLLRVFFNEDWVKRHLGQKGLKQILKSVVIGIPLPLCSCGVIPVAAGIRRQGGQRGAVAAFTASTPQTGVDSIAATVGMLGWVFTFVRVAIAFVNGIVAGLVVEWLDKGQRTKDEGQKTEGEGHCCCHEEEEETSCCGHEEPKEEHSCCSHEADAITEPASCCDSGEDSSEEKAHISFTSGLKFGLVTLPRDLFWALVIGLLIAGAIASLVPADFFSDLPGGRFGLYVAMTLISLPLYVCSTGSIPMAFSFLQAGMSPGAVLIFLIAGPASNTATVTSLIKIIGGKATLGYILSIIVTCWGVAILMDFSGLSILVSEAMHHHETGVNLFQQACGVALLGVLLVAKVKK
ncbi:MAG: SO_0444 family Cu/Zn efflux transporter [Puniceicoccaceae bacterium]